MKIQKIGMRTFKTAFAVFFTMLVSKILRIQSPFFAGIAAITAMKTSVSESFDVGKDRMQGTILGAIVALFFTSIATEHPLFIGLGVLIIIYICNVLELKQSTQLSTIVFLSIILNHDEGSRISYAFYRTIDTFVGLIIGTLINYFILPPNIKDDLIEGLENLYLYSKDIIRETVFDDSIISLEKFKEDLIILEEDYKILQRDNKLNLHENCNFSNFQQVLTLFETTYYHIGILHSIDGHLNIDETNKESLEKLLQNTLFVQRIEDKSNLDPIYNYHLREVLDNMFSIKNKIDIFYQ